jgi:hypothetical protein
MSAVSTYVVSLISKYRTRGIVIDTNLMVLLIVGNYDEGRISEFKRTIAYTPSDYRLVLELASRFDKRITSPNILTEMDNLSRQMPEKDHAKLAVSTRSILDTLIEIYTKSSDATQETYYSKYGLTDSITIGLSQDCLVLTDDFRLYNRPRSHKYKSSSYLVHLDRSPLLAHESPLLPRPIPLLLRLALVVQLLALRERDLDLRHAALVEVKS